MRAAKKMDIEAVDQMYEKLLLYEEINGGFSNWKRGIYPTRKTAENAIVSGTMFLEERNGEICASVILNHYQPDFYSLIPWDAEADENKVLVVHTLCVLPECSGNGLGRALMKYAMEKAALEGCKALRLDTFEGNIPARKMYESLGFKLKGSKKVLHEGLIEETLVFYEYEII